MFMWCYSLLVIFIIVSSSFAQNDHCRVGYYGNNCEVDCPEECRPLMTFPCDKQSGKCSEGCNEGFYGDQCDKTCSCPSGVCYQETGECYGTGTTTKNTTTIVECPTTVHTTLSEGVGAGWRTIAIILIILFITLVGGMVVTCLYFWWRKHGNFKKGDEEKGAETVPMVTSPAAVEEVGVAVAEVQSENPKLLDDLPSESKSVYKPGPEIEEKNEEIRKLKEENGHIYAMSKEMERSLSSYEYQEKEIQRHLGLPPNSTNHLMSYTNSGQPNWLQCPHLKFDSETVNLAAAGFGENMRLWNVPDHRTPKNNSKRFNTFRGTTCTEPLVQTGFYQYFEAIFSIVITQPVEEGGVVMQLGFCQEKDRDVTPFIERRKNCFVVQAVSCKEHNKLCLVSIRDGKMEHLQELMNNVVDSKEKIHIGMRLNKEVNKIALYDCREHKLLQNVKIDLGENIWPMFGVCEENKASVNVTLIAGQDIAMSGRKKERIKAMGMKHNPVSCCVKN